VKTHNWFILHTSLIHHPFLASCPDSVALAATTGLSLEKPVVEDRKVGLISSQSNSSSSVFCHDVDNTLLSIPFISSGSTNKGLLLELCWLLSLPYASIKALGL